MLFSLSLYLKSIYKNYNANCLYERKGIFLILNHNHIYKNKTVLQCNPDFVNLWGNVILFIKSIIHKID
jgi:hypothetical protein